MVTLANIAQIVFSLQKFKFNSIVFKCNRRTVLKKMYLNLTLAKYTLIKDIKRYEGFPHYYRTFKRSIPPLRGIA